MSTILIYGIDSLLGSYCAARLLQNPDTRICCLTSTLSIEETTDLLLFAATQVAEATATVPQREEIRSRLETVSSNLDRDALVSIATAGVDEAWYFVSAKEKESRAETLEGFMAALSPVHVKKFNYVVFDNPCNRELSTGKSVTNNTPAWISNEDISRQCQAQNIRYRIFLTGSVLGQSNRNLKNSGALPQFLEALHSFKVELEERAQQYFDYYALRCFAPANATLNILSAGIASGLILQIAQDKQIADSVFSIVNPQLTSFSALCEHISIAYGLGLLLVDDFGVLNAVDRAFHERVNGLQDQFLNISHVTPAKAGLLQLTAFDEPAQIQLLEAIRTNQDDARTIRETRISDLPSRLSRKVITRNGSDLPYYVGGTGGSTIVLLNALGQGLEFWYPLIEELEKNHRVITWVPRGTLSPAPPFGLADQVKDLDAIVHNENIETCHLVGWCTGPKVAIDFYLRRPEKVVSMAFLNSTFKCDDSPQELDSAYEKNLEFLCRRLIRKPSMADTMMKTFQSQAEEKDMNVLEGTDGQEIGVKVLSTINSRLRSFGLAPFRNERTTTNYAHQLVDFWSNDIRPKAPHVQCPVLLMSTEYDEIVSSASSRMAADLLSNACHIHVPAATHYCLYERADFVAELLGSFFEKSKNLSGTPSVRSTIDSAAGRVVLPRQSSPELADLPLREGA